MIAASGVVLKRRCDRFNIDRPCNVTAHTGVAATLFAGGKCVFAVIANIGMVSTAAFDDTISFDSFTACTLYFVLYFRWFRAVFSCFLSDWKPIKGTAFSDSSQIFALYNCRLILVEIASGFAIGLALVQRLICGLKYIAIRLGPVGEGRTRA